MPSAILYQNDDLGKDDVSAKGVSEGFDRKVVNASMRSRPTVDSQGQPEELGADALVIAGTPNSRQEIRKVSDRLEGDRNHIPVRLCRRPLARRLDNGRVFARPTRYSDPNGR